MQNYNCPEALGGWLTLCQALIKPGRVKIKEKDQTNVQVKDYYYNYV